MKEDLDKGIYGMGNGVAVGLIHRGCSSGACTLKLVPELP